MRSRILAAVRGEAEIFASEPYRPDRIAFSPRRRLVHALALLAAAALGALAMLIALESGRHDVRRSISAAGPKAALHRVGSRAQLIVSGMSEPPPGRVYELWTQRAGAAPRPTDALFTVTSTGMGTVEVPGGLRGVSAVMVTNEPRGGSAVPTSPAILRLAVPRNL
jgi:Anti-sigma-K factor rskA